MPTVLVWTARAAKKNKKTIQECQNGTFLFFHHSFRLIPSLQTWNNYGYASNKKIVIPEFATYCSKIIILCEFWLGRVIMMRFIRWVSPNNCWKFKFVIHTLLVITPQLSILLHYGPMCFPALHEKQAKKKLASVMEENEIRTRNAKVWGHGRIMTMRDLSRSCNWFRLFWTPLTIPLTASSGISRSSWVTERSDIQSSTDLQSKLTL